MPPTDRLAVEQPATTLSHDASNKFDFELNFSKKDIAGFETGAAVTVGALALGLYELRTGKLLSLASQVAPLAEDLGTSLWASAIKTTRLAPKTNYFQLKNGLEVTFDRNISLFSKPTDVVSVVDHLGNEAHLYGTGSRTVVRANVGNFLTPSEFFDQAGVGVHVPVPSNDLPSVLFQNNELTPKNLQLYSKLTNSFWTGYKKPLERMPDLLERASKF